MPGRGSRGLDAPDRHALFGRAAWSFLGQAVSSSSNFTLSVAVLSVVSASEFAVFALCITTYVLAIQLARATFGVPVTLLHANPSDRADHRAAIGAGVAVGVVTGLLALVASLITSHGRAQLFILAVALPFLLWQDMVRYVCFARGRPSVAAASDALWLALQLAGSVATFGVGRASAVTLLGVWAAAGATSALVFGFGLGLAPHALAAFRWVHRNSALCWRLLVEFMVAAGSHYCVYYILAIVSGADQLGRLKAAQTLLGPVIVLLLGGGVLGVPESVRAAHDPALLRRIAVRLSSALAGASLIWGAVTYVCLPLVGPVVFPNAWATARPLIPMLTVFSIVFAISIGATGALRALGATPWLLRVRTISGVGLVTISLPASAVLKANGALFSVAVVEGIVAVLAWRRLTRPLVTSTTIDLNDSGRTDSVEPDRPLPRPHEAGTHALWAGGRTPSPDIVAGMGPLPGSGAGPSTTCQSAPADHP